MRAAFRVPAEAEIEIAGRRVLLIDDVYTTGATVRAVAKALKKGGAGGGRRADLRACAAGGLSGRRVRDYIRVKERQDC